jgi:MbtH protein
MNDSVDGSGAEDAFVVLVNAAGQYCLWPSFREAPAGWTATGPRGAREECLEWIETHWTGMRLGSQTDS